MRGRKPGIESLRNTSGGVPSAPPPIPDWLDEDAVVEWRRIAPPLSLLGILTPVDMATLAAYCQAYSMWRKAELQVRADGLTVRGTHGELKAHPLIRVCTSLLTEIRRISSEFGFSPASRAAMGRRTESEETGSEKSDFEQFLDRSMGPQQV